MLIIRKSSLSSNLSGVLNKWYCTKILCPYDVTKSEVNTDEETVAKPYREIPGITRLQSLLGFLPGGKFRNKSFVQLQKDLYRHYGSIYKIPGFLGTKDIVFLVDPRDFEKVFRNEGQFPMRSVLESVDYYRKIHRPEKFESGVGLITQSGPDWWFFRQMANPIFLSTKIRQLYLHHTDEVACEFMKLLHNRRDVDNVIQGDLMKYLKLWSMETVVYILTGLRMRYLDKNQKQLEKASQFVEQFFLEVYQLNQQPSPWKYIATPTFTKHMKTQDDGYQFVYDIVEEAKRNLKNKPDDGKEKCMLAKIMEIDSKLSVVMLHDSILAGLETTAFAMTGFIYAIARNQDKQQIMRDEIERNFPRSNECLKPENLAQMIYSKLALKESLRLLPYFSGIFRQTGEDMTIKGYHIPKNTTIFMNTTLASLQETHLTDPESFRPERWLRSNRKTEKIDPFLSLPFGYGRRMCIGKRIVELEMEVLMIHLIRNYHIELEEEYLSKEYLPYDFPMEKLRFRFTEL